LAASFALKCLMIARIVLALFVRLWIVLNKLCGDVIWFMSAERLSWYVLFPLQMWFALQRQWLAWQVSLAISFLVVLFRGTIGNLRIRATYRARQRQQDGLDFKAVMYAQDVAEGTASTRLTLALFLRPFAFDAAIHARDPLSPEGYDGPSLETRLAAGFSLRWTTCSFSSPHGNDLNVHGELFANMSPEITVNHPHFYRYVDRLLYTRPGHVKGGKEWRDTFNLLASTTAPGWYC